MHLEKRKLWLVVILALAAAMLATGYVWAELLYRRHLYFVYGARPFLNHVDAGYFMEMPVITYCGAAAALGAAIISVRRRWWVVLTLCILVGAMAVAAPPVLGRYHRTHVLVTYDEFADRPNP